jgi:hypothetical protein
MRLFSEAEQREGERGREREGREREGRKERKKHQWTVMESREEGEAASAAYTHRPLSVVWEH